MLSSRKYTKYPEPAAGERTAAGRDSRVDKLLELIGERKRVLDLGCSHGQLAQLLTQRDCDVVGIDINPTAVEAARSYCTRAIVADLDVTPLSTLVEEASFDVVLCGDVLGHLRYPTRLLEEARALLRPGGALVASMRNVAHGAFRLKLLDGVFDYQELGTAEDSHLRFFTAKTVDELFVCAGYRIDALDRTKLALFGSSDAVPALDRDDYPDDVVEKIRRDPECETLQFVVKAMPLADDLASRAVAKRFLTVNTELATARSRIERLDGELAGTNAALAEIRSRVADIETQRTNAEESRASMEGELYETLSVLERAAADRDEAVRTVTALRGEVEAAGRLNTGLVAELRAVLEAPKVPDSVLGELDYVREELENVRGQLDEVQAQLDRAGENLDAAHGRNRELTELFVRHVEAGIDRVRAEMSDLATQIDQVQTGRIWRFKSVLRRLFRRGAAV